MNDFLTHLAVDGKVAASTQNQAFSAMLFLFSKVLDIPLAIAAARAKPSVRLPVVLSLEEVQLVLKCLPDGPMRLAGQLMYGAGLRLMEVCRLRVKDIDFARQQIVVRQGKGDKDRTGRETAPQRVLDRTQRVLEVAGGYDPGPYGPRQTIVELAKN